MDGCVWIVLFAVKRTRLAWANRMGNAYITVSMLTVLASGRTGFRLTKDVTTHPMLLKANKKSSVPPTVGSAAFEIPSTFVPISRSPESVAYLKRVHAYDAYLEGRRLAVRLSA